MQQIQNCYDIHACKFDAKEQNIIYEFWSHSPAFFIARVELIILIAYGYN